MIMIDEQKKMRLKPLYDAYGEFATIFDVLAKRKRNRKETPLDQIVSEIETDDLGPLKARQVVVELFRELANLGIGRLLVGRRARKTRFHWDEPMIDVVPLA